MSAIVQLVSTLVQANEYAEFRMIDVLLLVRAHCLLLHQSHSLLALLVERDNSCVEHMPMTIMKTVLTNERAKLHG